MVGGSILTIDIKLIPYTRFSRTYFVDATSLESLDSAFQSIGADAHLPTSKSSLHWLSSSKEEWLILFDNADDPSIDLREYIPSCSHGNIIITSRNPGMRKHAPQSHYHIGGLDPEEAMTLLLQSSMLSPDNDDQQYATSLLQVLEHLALAIVQAGAFISESPGLTFKGYLEMYRTNQAKLLLGYAGQKVDSYKWTVYTTWQISFQKLEQQSSIAAQLFMICAFWHHESIPKALFQNAVVGAGDYKMLPLGWEEAVKVVNTFCDADGSWNDLKFQEAINKLNSFSLISYFKDQFSLHPLVRSWAQYDCQQRSLKIKQVSGYMLGLAVRDKEGSNEYLMRKVCAPHIKAWHGHQSNADVLDFQLGIKLSKVYRERGWWTDKEKLDTEVLEHTEKSFREDHPFTLTSMANLASTYWNQGRWSEAEQLHSKVMDKRKAVLGKDHPDTLSSMSNLALTYQDQGRWSEAELLHSRVMEKRKVVLGENHPDTLISMNNLAITYQDQGRWSEAKQLHSIVMEKRKVVLGEDHPSTLISMDNLALIYQKQGRWIEAEQLHSKVMDKKKVVLGEDHPSTLSSMDHLALVYQDQGRWIEAEQLHSKVMDQRKVVLGEDHPSTLISMNNLALVYQKQCRWIEAEQLHLQEMAKSKAVLGEDHPSTLISMDNLEVTYQNQGRWSEAELLHSKVIEKRKAVLWEDHPDTLRNLNKHIRTKAGGQRQSSCTLQ